MHALCSIPTVRLSLEILRAVFYDGGHRKVLATDLRVFAELRHSAGVMPSGPMCQHSGHICGALVQPPNSTVNALQSPRCQRSQPNCHHTEPERGKSISLYIYLSVCDSLCS